jgi:anti-sigma B factor antagonist
MADASNVSSASLAGTQPFSYEIEPEQGATTLRLAGDLDMAASPTLREVLQGLQRGGSEMIVDLRRLTFLDSVGLAVLLEAHTAGREGLPSVSFIPGGRCVQKVFSVTGMDKRVSWIDPLE